MSIAVLGAGGFGTALAMTLARAGREVTLWGRDPAQIAAMRTEGVNRRYLPDAPLPKGLALSDDLDAATRAETLLLAVPAQKLPDLLAQMPSVRASEPQALVACCKGIDLGTGQGPVGTIHTHCPEATAAVLTGPSFAADIARGLPTALTLACADPEAGRALQHQLATPVLRLYLSRDTAGAELGGALKNVIAIACGAAIGAGLGDSARAAVMTRGFAEMQRLVPVFGGRPETLAGLSGFGDLALTCTSELSRNYRYGLALGQGRAFDSGITVEGAATAHAVRDLAQKHGLDLPISAMVSALVRGKLSPEAAMQTLLARPLKEE